MAKIDMAFFPSVDGSMTSEEPGSHTTHRGHRKEDPE